MDVAAESLRLFLFSDHRIPANRPLDNRILEVAGTASPSVGWIPAGSRPEKVAEFFDQRRCYYADFDVIDVKMFPVHQEFDEARIPWLMSRDIIHLSGGDPFVFLRNLKRTGMLEVLRSWALRGGILVGDSAGAMLMTANIEIARFGLTPVPANLPDLTALGLVDFEFNPHLGSYGVPLEGLRGYSQQKDITVYGAPDGCGIAVVDGKIECHGPVVCFKHGREEP
ncbi:MAG: peptidase E [Methylacidiphilales bacterium]|nr:peptidase E [Candidatus Methylacidiphilales bacterium]